MESPCAASIERAVPEVQVDTLLAEKIPREANYQLPRCQLVEQGDPMQFRNGPQEGVVSRRLSVLPSSSALATAASSTLSSGSALTSSGFSSLAVLNRLRPATRPRGEAEGGRGGPTERQRTPRRGLAW